MRSIRMRSIWALAGMLLFLSGTAAGACRFEVDEIDVRETRVFVIARGFNTGLSGHFGRNKDQYYLRGRYFSQFAATPSFDIRTPLEFTFADETTMTLPVLEGAAGKLDFNPMLANNRETLPVFAIEAEQLRRIGQDQVVAVQVLRVDKGEVGAKYYKVAKGAARKMAEAAECVFDHPLPSE